jgi:hypothetical protein
MAAGVGDRQARNCHPLASRRLQILPDQIGQAETDRATIG